MRKKRLAILGSTGSIGTQTLDVAAALADQFEVIGLSARKNLDILADQARKFHPQIIGVVDEESAAKLKALLGSAWNGNIVLGDAGLSEIASRADVDLVVVAIVGAAGLSATMAAARAGKQIGFASKEVLVAAGDLVMKTVKENNATLLPIDSEHCAIFQCLQGENPKTVSRIILTASGGPFLNAAIDEIEEATVADALNHPTWKMGNKITIDSATLMNKGLEVIEAHYLYGIPYEKIDVVVHPQSIVHSMVEFVDGSVMAQLSSTDMRHPIQYCLTYPERRPAAWPRIELSEIGKLTFEKPDLVRFPCLQLAYEAGRRGGPAGTVLNAANEEAVKLFLDEKIKFGDIPRLIDEALRSLGGAASTGTLDEIVELDRMVRQRSKHYAVSAPASD